MSGGIIEEEEEVEVEVEVEAEGKEEDEAEEKAETEREEGKKREVGTNLLPCSHRTAHACSSPSSTHHACHWLQLQCATPHTQPKICLQYIVKENA
jgi:hypothetical protein